VKPMEIEVDKSFVSRLLLGALSEHEQRLMTANLARSNAMFRTSILQVVEPFEMFDRDLAEEYSAVLDQIPQNADRVRYTILARAFARADDLEQLIRDFTVRDILALGEATQRWFSWSMAEFLIQRAENSARGSYEARTSLYLAMMVIDVVDVLGSAGHSPDLVALVADVRRRIQQATARQEN